MTSTMAGEEDKETTRTDYISAPQETLRRVIEKCFPLPPLPRAMRDLDKRETEAANGKSKVTFSFVCV